MIDVGFVANVGLNAKRRRFSQQGCRLAELIDTPTGQRHAVTFGIESEGHRPPDAAACSRDNRHAIDAMCHLMSPALD